MVPIWFSLGVLLPHNYSHMYPVRLVLATTVPSLRSALSTRLPLTHWSLTAPIAHTSCGFPCIYAGPFLTIIKIVQAVLTIELHSLNASGMTSWELFKLFLLRAWHRSIAAVIFCTSVCSVDSLFISSLPSALLTANCLLLHLFLSWACCCIELLSYSKRLFRFCFLVHDFTLISIFSNA